MTRKILLIDDDKDIRANLQEALEYDGHQVLTAVNGKDALDKLSGLPPDQLPDLILLDLMMPVMDGHLFMQTIEQKHLNQFGHIPIILLSAQDNLTFTGRKIPAAILKKPMKLDALFQTIEKYFSSNV